MHYRTNNPDEEDKNLRESITVEFSDPTRLPAVKEELVEKLNKKYTIEGLSFEIIP